MFDAFQDKPDLTPYDTVPATIPLDQGPGLAGTPVSSNPTEKAWLKAFLVGRRKRVQFRNMVR